MPNRVHSSISNLQIDDVIQYTSFRIHPMFGIVLKLENRKLNECLIPRKRYFIDSGYSIPLSIENND